MTTTYAALLRGINVGGRRKVPMADLRELLTGLGHGDVRTLLQSGNAVFTAPGKDPAVLAGELEQALGDRFGFEVPCIVLDAAELRETAEGNPFPPGSFDPARLVVTFLAGPVDRGRLSGVDPEAYLPDEFRVGTREIYLHCPGGLGRSRLADVLGRLDLGVTATARNWNTVTRLRAMTDPS